MTSVKNDSDVASCEMTYWTSDSKLWEQKKNIDASFRMQLGSLLEQLISAILNMMLISSIYTKNKSIKYKLWL